MNQSRNKGGDAGVKQNLVNARSQAAFYYNGAATSTNTYVGMCNDSVNGIKKQMQSSARASGITPKVTYLDTDASTGDTEVCHANASAFAIWAPLKGSTDASIAGWCIDSVGASKRVTSGLGASAYTCP